MTKEPRKEKGPKHYDSNIPIYYLYGEDFSSCDKFNVNLKDHIWPFRHSSSHYYPAYIAKEHDFAFSSLLFCRTVSTYISALIRSGKTNLVAMLVDELYNYAMELGK